MALELWGQCCSQRRYWRNFVASVGAGLVFHRNGKPIDSRARTIRDHHFYPLITRRRLPKMRLHDLRHLHGSYLVAQGVDLASVAERLGHASKSFTLQTYVHGMGQEKVAKVANTLLTLRTTH